MALEIAHDLTDAILRGLIQRRQRSGAEDAVDDDAVSPLEAGDRACQITLVDRAPRRIGLDVAAVDEVLDGETLAQRHEPLDLRCIAGSKAGSRRYAVPAASRRDVTIAAKLLAQRAVLLVLRTHQLDRAVERTSPQSTSKQAVDIGRRLANAPVGLDLLRIDLPRQ